LIRSLAQDNLKACATLLALERAAASFARQRLVGFVRSKNGAGMMEPYVQQHYRSTM
jgi:hypothetical protein